MKNLVIRKTLCATCFNRQYNVKLYQHILQTSLPIYFPRVSRSMTMTKIYCKKKNKEMFWLLVRPSSSYFHAIFSCPHCSRDLWMLPNINCVCCHLSSILIDLNVKFLSATTSQIKVLFSLKSHLIAMGFCSIYSHW